MKLINRFEIMKLFKISEWRFHELKYFEPTFPKPVRAPINRPHLWNEQDIIEWSNKYSIQDTIKPRKNKYIIKPNLDGFDNKMAVAFITAGNKKRFKKYGVSTKVSIQPVDIDYTLSIEYSLSSQYNGIYNLLN